MPRILLHFANTGSCAPSTMQGMKDSEVDFPFKLSPDEEEIVKLRPDPPCSVILLGRSGTGKTTCAVFRMFGAWLQCSQPGAEPHNMVRLA